MKRVEKELELTFVSSKISLEYFLEWVKENVPKDAADVTLGIKESGLYDDLTTPLVVSWIPSQNKKSGKKK